MFHAMLSQIKAYRNFFGLDDAAEKNRTPADEVLSATKQSDIDEARSSMPADKVLSMQDEQSEDEESQAEEPDEQRDQESMVTSNGRYEVQQWEIDYAESVELTNGRWAQLGFLTLITVEAFTGNGLVGQMIAYGKLTGILGAESGF